MKILTLNYEYPPLGGGAGVITKNICKGLSRLGHSVSVITAGIYENNGRFYEDNIEIIRLPSKRKHKHKSDVSEMLSWIDLAIPESLKFCETNKPDLVFAHFALPGGAVARVIKKKTGIPYVIMSHGHDIPWYFPQQMFFYHLATYFRIKGIYKDSEALFLQSQFMKENADRFSGKNNRHKNIIIPNGCDIENFQIVKPNKDDCLRIFTGGRMVAQKDPLTLIRAVEILKQESLPFHLTIAGDGPLLPSIKKYCEQKNLTSDITFTGWLGKDEIYKHLAASHVFVLPSLNEGMSISLIEALSCGIYSIVTPISGNTDLVKEEVNGKFFPVRDFRKLSQELIIFNKKRQAEYPVNEEDVKMFRLKYNWNVIAEQYEKELKKIVL